MKLQLKKGTTSKLIDIFIQDSSVTTGVGLTGLVFNSAGLTAYYYREGATGATAITLATMTLGTWTTGGFVVVDGTNMPGCYQLSIPDAALATGANSVIVMLKGATNMAPLLLEIELTAFDNQTAIAQTGDAYARLGAPAGASIAADIVVIDNFVDDLETRLSAVRAGYIDNLSAGAVAQASVCTEGRLAELDGVNLPTDVANVKTDTAATLLDTGTDGVVVASGSKTGYTLSATGIQAIWDALTSALTTVGSIGKLFVDNINATISSRSSHSAADVWAAATRTLTNIGIKKNTALSNFEFLMLDSADHVTPKTGLTITATRSIDGAAFGACANSATEVANGIYKINLANTDLNGDVITLRFTATGADNRLLTIITTV